ncbi:hypothetical protein F4805DRAFT_236870 [Annulohypoxylon moriforme]|nr:hypothetical protein F4805DRAFT_236870 [Annulohypoxylon moriforme]
MQGKVVESSRYNGKPRELVESKEKNSSKKNVTSSTFVSTIVGHLCLLLAVVLEEVVIGSAHCIRTSRYRTVPIETGFRLLALYIHSTIPMSKLRSSRYTTRIADARQTRRGTRDSTDRLLKRRIPPMKNCDEDGVRYARTLNLIFNLCPEE